MKEVLRRFYYRHSCFGRHNWRKGGAETMHMACEWEACKRCGRVKNLIWTRDDYDCVEV